MTIFGRKKQKDTIKKHDEFVIDDKFKVIFNSKGLVPVVIQDESTSEVLRLGYLDRWALEMSLKGKKVYLFRRSLQRLEVLGEDQNIEYKISEIKLGRDNRSLLFQVIPSEAKVIKSNFSHTLYSEKK